METYDLIYIALIILTSLIIVKSGIRLFRYREEEVDISQNPENGFLFTSYESLNQLFYWGITMWLLSQQPLEKSSVYIILLISVFTIHAIVLLIRWPGEILTIEQDRLNFRFGNSRRLDEIKGVTVAHDHVVIHAKNFPKKTRFLKSRCKSDWDHLNAAVLEFVAQNPDIEIRHIDESSEKARP